MQHLGRLLLPEEGGRKSPFKARFGFVDGRRRCLQRCLTNGLDDALRCHGWNDPYVLVPAEASRAQNITFGALGMSDFQSECVSH